MAKRRNRAAQDTTLINLRALKKRIAKLERMFRGLDARVDVLGGKVVTLEMKRSHLKPMRLK